MKFSKTLTSKEITKKILKGERCEICLFYTKDLGVDGNFNVKMCLMKAMISKEDVSPEKLICEYYINEESVKK